MNIRTYVLSLHYNFKYNNMKQNEAKPENWLRINAYELNKVKREMTVSLDCDLLDESVRVSHTYNTITIKRAGLDDRNSKKFTKVHRLYKMGSHTDFTIGNYEYDEELSDEDIKVFILSECQE